jgi:hypothetical protein
MEKKKGKGKRAEATPKFLETLQKIRGDWGEVKPYTRIIPDKKRYDRKQNRKLEKQAYNDYRR